MSEKVILVVHHFVEDFDTWKPVFDEHEAVRRSHGETEHRLYQDIHNPNRLVIHNDFPSAEAAQGFGATRRCRRRWSEPVSPASRASAWQRWASGSATPRATSASPSASTTRYATSTRGSPSSTSTRPFAAGTARSSTGSTASR